jgi:hypothetical protein
MDLARLLPFLFHGLALGSVTAVQCDITIAGGSTASLAAAITAAEAAPDLKVCFTEITDWPGGQMTAGGVPAIDFGGPNRLSQNQPQSFRDAMAYIPGDGSLPQNKPPFQGSGSPGACAVSTKCYLPNDFVNGWVMPRLARSSNLDVYLRTAITKTKKAANGSISSLTAVQRFPRAGTPEWSQRLSEELPDWYNPADSPSFTKHVLQFNSKVFIEATELGDVLATSGLDFVQGLEYPLENSTDYNSVCGQAQTLTFYMEMLEHPPLVPDPAPAGSAETSKGWIDVHRFTNASTAPLHGWWHTLTWRRSFCAGPNCSLGGVNAGDITQQNLGNDLDFAYMFPPLAVVKAEAKAGWKGGVNLTALRMLEDRAHGWFHYVKNASGLIDASWPARLVINRTTSGTLHGLSKMVYWRDTRRAIGIDGWRLMHPPLRDTMST